MQVAIALFPRNTALDAIGPYEVLQRVPSIDVVFVGHQRGEVRSDNGMLGLTCDATFDEVTRPDVLVFPGGIGTRTLDRGRRRSSTGSARCTGTRCSPPRCAPAAWCWPPPACSTGLTATTHWRATELLESFGAIYAPQRVVEHLPQRIITAAGVSSGIDMALRLVELLVGPDAAQAAS